MKVRRAKRGVHYVAHGREKNKRTVCRMNLSLSCFSHLQEKKYTLFYSNRNVTRIKKKEKPHCFDIPIPELQKGVRPPLKKDED